MKKLFIFILVLIMFGLMALLGIQIYNLTNNENDNIYNLTQKLEEQVIPEKQIEIFQGNERPIAVMIDNVGSARPQAGLNDAYLVYEIIVEGKQLK